MSRNRQPRVPAPARPLDVAGVPRRCAACSQIAPHGRMRRSPVEGWTFLCPKCEARYIARGLLPVGVLE